MILKLLFHLRYNNNLLILPESQWSNLPNWFLVFLYSLLFEISVYLVGPKVHSDFCSILWKNPKRTVWPTQEVRSTRCNWLKCFFGLLDTRSCPSLIRSNIPYAALCTWLRARLCRCRQAGVLPREWGWPVEASPQRPARQKRGACSRTTSWGSWVLSRILQDFWEEDLFEHLSWLSSLRKPQPREKRPCQAEIVGKPASPQTSSPWDGIHRSLHF